MYYGQEEWKALFQGSSQPIIVLNIDKDIIAINNSALKMFNKTEEEALGSKYYELFHGTQEPPASCPVNKLLLDGSADPVEMEIETLNGIFMVFCMPIPDDSGKIVRIVLMAIDITERKKAEEALRASEDKLLKVFNFSPALMAISSLKDGRFIDVNKSFLETLGYKKEEVIGFTSNELNLFVNYEDRQKIVEALKDSGEIFDVETRIISKTHGIRTGLFSAGAIEIQGEECLITVFKDISEIKEAEKELKTLSFNLNKRVKELNCLHSITTLANKEDTSQEDLLQGIVEAIPLAYQYPDIAGARIIIYSNEHRTKNFRETPWNLKSDIVVFGKTEGCVEVCYAEESNVFNNDPFLEEEKTLIIIIAERAGKIMERIKAIQSLNNSEQKYRSIFDNAVEGIFQTTTDGRFMSANHALAKMFGYDSPEDLIKGVTDLSIQGYVNPEDRVKYKNILEEQGTITGFETQHYRKDGSIIWVLINARMIKDEAGRALYYEGTLEEVTQRKLAEEQLRSERLRFSILSDNAPFGMAMIDKDGKFIYINPKFKEIFGYGLSDIPDGKKWFKKVYPDPEYRHKVIASWIEDLKGAEPGECRPRIFTVTCKDGVEKIINFIPVQLGTGVQIMTCEDITPRKHAEEQLKQAAEKLRKSLAGTIQAMSLTVETRDPYTAGHQRRVAHLARKIGQEMGLSNDTIDNIRMAGIIHDIGKISVPAELLAKPTKLADIEMSLIKVHSQSGYDILKDVDLPYPIAEIVLQHHERLDGSGYPQGLKNEQILLEAKIICVADVVEAIASNRPYRPAKGIEIALEEIEKNKGILYDEGVVDVCLKLFREKGFNFE
jgi:PAS domain S-box-containing protein